MPRGVYERKPRKPKEIKEKYCHFGSSASYCHSPYLCCNYCKKTCENQCKDDGSRCEFQTDSYPRRIDL